MTNYLIRTGLQSVLVVVLVSMLVFLIMRALPGDPIAALTSESTAGFDEAQTEALRERLGLNDSLPVQYLKWAGNAARGDFGVSSRNRLPVVDEIKRRIPATIQLAAAAMTVGMLLGVSFGIIAALKPNSPVDMIVTLFAMSGIAVPGFVISMGLIWFFTVNLHWLPVGGYVPIWEEPLQALKSLAMPVAVLSLSIAAPIMRHTRSSLLEVLRQDYIRTARAKGLGTVTVVTRHALRNGLLPVVTVAGLRVAGLLEGSVIVESVFSVPGLGRLAVGSIGTRDYPMLQGIVVVFAVVNVGVNLLVDIAYTRLDPTIKYS